MKKLMFFLLLAFCFASAGYAQRLVDVRYGGYAKAAPLPVYITSSTSGAGVVASDVTLSVTGAVDSTVVGSDVTLSVTGAVDSTHASPTSAGLGATITTANTGAVSKTFSPVVRTASVYNEGPSIVYAAEGASASAATSIPVPPSSSFTFTDPGISIALVSVISTGAHTVYVGGY